MAEVTVFVDDAVLGHFPPVCAVHGDAIPDVMLLSQPVGTAVPGVLWLLVLVGPLGWLALVVISISRTRDDVLSVRLPGCESTVRSNRTARRSRMVAALASAALGITTLAVFRSTSSGVGFAIGTLLVLATVLALAETIHEHQVCRRSSVQLSLDASRRWVTIRGVHPIFKASVSAGGNGMIVLPDDRPV
jgi:hypothetical protein